MAAFSAPLTDIIPFGMKGSFVRDTISLNSSIVLEKTGFPDLARWTSPAESISIEMAITPASSAAFIFSNTLSLFHGFRVVTATPFTLRIGSNDA